MVTEMSSLRFPLATAVCRSMDEEDYVVTGLGRIPIHAIWAWDEDQRRVTEHKMVRALAWDGVYR